MITFNCGNCGQEVNVAFAYAGKRRPCPKCRVTVEVPAASPAKRSKAPVIVTILMAQCLMLLYLSAYVGSLTDEESWLYSLCAVVASLGFLGICTIMVISEMFVLYRLGYHAWSMFVPVYNYWVYAKVGGMPGWFGVMVFFIQFIPIIGNGMLLGLIIGSRIGMAHACGYRTRFGLGLVFLAIFFLPILAFSEW